MEGNGGFRRVLLSMYNFEFSVRKSELVNPHHRRLRHCRTTHLRFLSSARRAVVVPVMVATGTVVVGTVVVAERTVVVVVVVAAERPWLFVAVAGTEPEVVVGTAAAVVVQRAVVVVQRVVVVTVGTAFAVDHRLAVDATAVAVAAVVAAVAATAVADVVPQVRVY